MSIWPWKMHIVVGAMARRGAAARMRRKSAELYCHSVVENLIARVDGECVCKVVLDVSLLSSVIMHLELDWRTPMHKLEFC